MLVLLPEVLMKTQLNIANLSIFSPIYWGRMCHYMPIIPIFHPWTINR